MLPRRPSIGDVAILPVEEAGLKQQVVGEDFFYCASDWWQWCEVRKLLSIFRAYKEKFIFFSLFLSITHPMAFCEDPWLLQHVLNFVSCVCVWPLEFDIDNHQVVRWDNYPGFGLPDYIVFLSLGIHKIGFFVMLSLFEKSRLQHHQPFVTEKCQHVAFLNNDYVGEHCFQNFHDPMQADHFIYQRFHCFLYGSFQQVKICTHTLDGSEIPKANHRLDGAKNLGKLWDFNYQPQLVNAGFFPSTVSFS